MSRSALNAIFQQELGRDIGSAGMETFGNALAGGMSLDQIRQSVAGSAEARAATTSNTASDVGQINQVYQNTLGREVDPEGLDFYSKALRAGTPIEEIRRSVQNSQESQRLLQSESPQTGLIGSEQALQAGLAGSLAALTEGLGQSKQSIQQGQQFLQPFAEAGGKAIDLQAALSGASGSGAQQQAFDDFNSSPGQEFLRNRGERALLRNSGAIGGLGGGRVRQALTEHGIGMAQQDFGNQFNRLGQVSGMGMNGAGIQAGLSGQLAGEQGLAGRTAGNYAFGTGQQLAGGRTRAGEMISQAIGGTTQGLAGLQQQYGAGQSGITGAAGGNLANILAGAGQQQGAGQMNIATLLANLATQQGSTVAGLPGIPGIQQTQGILQGLGSAAGGIGTAMGASDIRLKENITPAGTSQGGYNLYTWDWNEHGQRIAGDQPGFGVMAQEVGLKDSEAVQIGPHGFMMVDYSRIH